MKLTKEAEIVHSDDRTAVIQHDARSLPIPDESVDLIITSPPYFAVREYRDDDGELKGQIGNEPTPMGFLDALDECMVEWGRVLKPGGSVWVNLNDKYAGAGGTGDNTGLSGATYDHDAAPDKTGVREYRKGLEIAKRKSLMGIPWRFAIRQIDAGWVLRSEVIWDKPSGMPEAVTDRVRRSHETWFHFTKGQDYFSAMDEIRVPYAKDSERRMTSGGFSKSGFQVQAGRNDSTGKTTGETEYPEPNELGRIPGSVWRIPLEALRIPQATKDHYELPGHFAAFPQEWPRRIILAFSPEDGVVLDPFGGTGTTAGVARMLGREAINNDLSTAYNRLAVYRIWESKHFSKTESAGWMDKQGAMFA